MAAIVALFALCYAHRPPDLGRFLGDAATLQPLQSWIKTACRKHLLQEKIAWEVSYLHDQILAELQSTGLRLLDNSQDPDPVPQFSSHPCDAILLRINNEPFMNTRYIKFLQKSATWFNPPYVQDA